MSDEIATRTTPRAGSRRPPADLTGDEDLKREGKVDQAAGKVKEGVEKVTDKVKDALRRD